MPELFRDQFRVSSTRLPHWDYAEAGMYFVTICTKGMACHFGEVEDAKVNLSNEGQIVKIEIMRTEEIRENVKIDSFIVMPNHIHLIIMLKETDYVETPRRGVCTEEARKWKPNCLGSIVNQLKGACTRQIHQKFNSSFAWQPRFYDHIIRSEDDLLNLREYIQLNPKNWLLKSNKTPSLEVPQHA